MNFKAVLGRCSKESRCLTLASHSMHDASAACCRLSPSPALARLFQALGEAENACETDGPRQQASRAKLLVSAPPLDMTPVHGMAAE